MLIPLLIREGDYNGAAQRLANYPRQTDEQIAFYDLHTWINTLLSEGRSYFDMTNEEESTLRQIAATETPYAYNALAILRLVFDEEIPINIQIPDTVQTRRASAIGIEQPASFSMYPNPAEGKLMIECQLNEENTTATLQLLDLYGHLLHKEQLSKQQSTMYWDLSTYPSGVYIVHMTMNGQTIQYSKLIIQR